MIFTDPSVYILFATLLFVIGLAGFIKSRSAVRMLIAIEIMLNAANINFAVFSLFYDKTFVTGIMAVIISISLAAAEAAVGLGIILSVYRKTGSVEATDFIELRG